MRLRLRTPHRATPPVLTGPCQRLRRPPPHGSPVRRWGPAEWHDRTVIVRPGPRSRACSGRVPGSPWTGWRLSCAFSPSLAVVFMLPAAPGAVDGPEHGRGRDGPLRPAPRRGPRRTSIPRSHSAVEPSFARALEEELNDRANAWRGVARLWIHELDRARWRGPTWQDHLQSPRGDLVAGQVER